MKSCARALAILAIALGLTAPTASAAWKAGSTALTATSSPKTWTSTEKFAESAVLIIGVSVGGDELTPSQAGHCRIDWVGHGVTARTKTCGAGATPLRVTYVSLGAPTRFRVAWRLG